jgi:hypothetical protein
MTERVRIVRELAPSFTNPLLDPPGSEVLL